MKVRSYSNIKLTKVEQLSIVDVIKLSFNLKKLFSSLIEKITKSSSDISLDKDKWDWRFLQD